jgi:hypothetical protein
MNLIGSAKDLGDRAICVQDEMEDGGAIPDMAARGWGANPATALGNWMKVCAECVGAHLPASWLGYLLANATTDCR